ncbi:hypothetical protein PoB_000948100 [Plakobranchus ocellatus]|uniref:Uncharacterized protein n=1 Tax=Plakobranchus ocellatus TaxID=259542 RepID=A0AAV3YKR9_9GAST|nr:hypothetical protein PoB_000948100 [Plakobranchus ocellatus]
MFQFQSAIASLTAVMASAAIGIEIFGVPTKAFYEQQLRVIIGNAAFNKRFLYLSGITCCLSLFIKILYALVNRKSVGLIWYNSPHSKPDGKQVSQVIRTETGTWMTSKKPLPYEPEIHPNWPLHRMYFPNRELVVSFSQDKLGNVDRIDLRADRSSVQFATPVILGPGVNLPVPSFSRHAIHRDDDGTFSVFEPATRRSSSGTVRIIRGSVSESEKATGEEARGVASVEQAAPGRVASVEQAVSFEAMLHPVQRLSAAPSEDTNINRDDSGLNYGHGDYERHSASLYGNGSNSVSAFTHTMQSSKYKFLTLGLQSENSKESLAQRQDSLIEESDICQYCTRQQSISDVHIFDAQRQEVSNTSSHPNSLITTCAGRDTGGYPHISGSKNINKTRKMEFVRFFHLPCRERTKTHKMRSSLSPEPYFSSSRFSRNASYFDKLINNHQHRSGKGFLHDRNTDLYDSPDRNYSISDLSVDHNHLRSSTAASESVGVDEDACLGTDTCSDTNTFSDVSHNLCETNMDTFKTRFTHGGKQSQERQDEKCAIHLDTNRSARDQVESSKTLGDEEAIDNTQVSNSPVDGRVESSKTLGDAVDNTQVSNSPVEGRVESSKTLGDAVNKTQVSNSPVEGISSPIFLPGLRMKKGRKPLLLKVASVDWLVLVVTVLLFEILVLEPCIFLCSAAVSTHLRTTPILIQESLERFKVVIRETTYRDRLIDMSLARRHMTSFVYSQAAPDSACLYHLHDKIYSALRKTRRLPEVVFDSGVYLLIAYTLCTSLLAKLNTNISLTNIQSNYVSTILGLQPNESIINVEEMWTFFEERLIPGLLDFEEKLMEEDGQEPNDTGHGIGYMLISPVQFRQIRVKPNGEYTHRN